MRMRALLSLLCFCFLLAATAWAQVSPESAEKYVEGQELFKKRRYQDALNAFQKAVDLDADNAQAYRAIGRTYKELKDYDKSVEAYELAIAVKPDYAAAFYELGQVQFYSLREFHAAQTSFQRVLQIDPEFDEGKARGFLKAAYIKQGNTFFKQRNFKGAAKKFGNAAQVDPSDATTFYNLGLAHRYAREYSRSEDALTTAVELDPKYAKAHKSLGDLHKLTGKNSRAARSYRRAIDIEPRYIDAYLSLSVVYIEKMKLPAKAVPLLKKALTIPLEDVSAFYKEIRARVNPTKKRAEVQLNLGAAYVAQKKFASGFAAYNKAIKLNADPESHYRLADAYLKAGKYNNALKSARRAFGSKYHVPAHVVAGGAYEKLRPEGWKEKAIAHYQKGLKDRRYQKHCEDMIHRIRNPMGEAEDEG